MNTTLLAITALLVANAFFVAAEFALVKAKTFRIQALADQGDRKGILTLHIQSKLEAYLAACQLGITMASLGLGWVGEPAVAALVEPVLREIGLGDAAIHTVAFLIGFTVFSSLHIVVGEQVPKTFAIRKAEPVSLWVAYPLHFFYLLAFPLNWLLNESSRALLRMLRVREAGHGEVLSDDELRGLLDLSVDHGEVAEDKGRMIHNIFEFDSRRVVSLMIPRSEVDTLDVTASPEVNAARIRETGHSRLPLVSGGIDNVIGVILTKDLLAAALDGVDAPWSRLEDYRREAVLVPESTKVRSLFEQMRKSQAHMAIVIDEYGGMSGIVTLEDLLEELVGEIADELDDEGALFNIVALDNGWDVHGLVPLADLERATGLRVVAPLGGAQTLSGLIMRRMERLPRVGDSITEGGYRIEVTSMGTRHPERCRILPPQEIEEDMLDPS